MRHARAVQIAYTGVAGLGLVGAIVLLVIAGIDLIAVLRSGRNGNRRRTARRNVRESVRKLVTFVAFLGIGLIALSVPLPVQTANQQANVATGGILLVLDVYLAADTFWTIWDEYQIRLRLWFYDRAFPTGRNG